MFSKKDIIFSESIGVCVVDDIVKLSADKNSTPVSYYLLRSVFDKKKVSYIPVEKHDYILRELITKKEALDIKNSDAYQKLDAMLVAELDYVLADK